MHLVALVDRPDHVCCRYRVAAFEPHWRRAGHTLELISWPRRWWEWFRIGSLVRHADAVILQRKLLSRWQLHLLRRATKQLIFDFDDAVFLRDSYAARGLHSGSRLRRFAATLKACDAVVAGNQFLAQNARRFTAADRVHVIPTCVEPSRYPFAQHDASNDIVRLVWVGSSSTLQGLEMIRPLLEELGRNVPNLRLKLICDRFLDLEHLPVEKCVWSEATEAADIAAADIGISWIPDDDWSRGKCGLKVLQYMAAALPVVANPVGVHAEMIQDGETGYLAGDVKRWVGAIARLAGDLKARRAMGRQARGNLEGRYSVAVGARIWLRVMDAKQGMKAAS